MVALHSDEPEPTRRGWGKDGSVRVNRDVAVPFHWRWMTAVDRAFVRMVGKIEITGEFPDELRGRPVLIAANHIGMFDPFVLIAACRQLGVTPRFMLTAGLLDAPVIGYFLRKSGQLRVDRGKSNVAEAFGRATESLRTMEVPLLVYPEGQISTERGLWPERGKTGVARMALGGNIPVITISQWGAHEAVYWGCDTVRGWSDFQPYLTSWLKAIVRRPTFKVHFGPQVDLSGLEHGRPGDAVRAHKRIMQAITTNLVPLRTDEPDVPRFHDPTRPTDGKSPWRP